MGIKRRILIPIEEKRNDSDWTLRLKETTNQSINGNNNIQISSERDTNFNQNNSLFSSTENNNLSESINQNKDKIKNLEIMTENLNKTQESYNTEFMNIISVIVQKIEDTNYNEKHISEINSDIRDLTSKLINLDNKYNSNNFEIKQLSEKLININSELSNDYVTKNQLNSLYQKIENILDSQNSDEIDSNSNRITELENSFSNYFDLKENQSDTIPKSKQIKPIYESSLDDIIHQNSKIKFKNKKTKENSKIQIHYDSLNPGLIEIQPLIGNKIALTSHSRNIDSNDNFSNTLIYDPLNSDYNQRQNSEFFEKMNEHSADGTLDSIIRSLTNPKINKYLDKKIDSKFKKHINSITEILSENYSGNHSNPMSDVTNLTIYRNKKSNGFNSLKKKSRLLGLSGTAAPIAIKASSIYNTISKLN